MPAFTHPAGIDRVLYYADYSSRISELHEKKNEQIFSASWKLRKLDI